MPSIEEIRRYLQNETNGNIDDNKQDYRQLNIDVATYDKRLAEDAEWARNRETYRENRDLIRRNENSKRIDERARFQELTRTTRVNADQKRHNEKAAYHSSLVTTRAIED